MVTKQRSSAKADFIRSFSVNTPASEVVEKAKAAGLSVSPAHVYGVRKTMGAGRTKGSSVGRASSVAGGRTPANSISAVPEGGPAAGSKKAFVLSYPDGTPAQDIVRAAAERGIDLSPGYLYWVRSEATRTGRRAGKGASASQPTVRAVGSSGRTSSGDAERLIIDTALRVVGIERAIAVLEAARDRLGRLLEE